MSSRFLFRALMFGAAVALYSAAGMAIAARGAENGPENGAAMPKLAAGKTVHFPNGYWSGLPQTGPDGKVRQCVMVAERPRAGTDGNITTDFSVNIGTGAGLTFAMMDDKLPTEQIMDDEAEITLDGHSFPAVAFTVGSSLAFHPGDAAGVLAALGKTDMVRLRSDGAGVDTGPIALDLHGDAYSWLKQCGTRFKIAIDQPTDPKAAVLPVPRPHSPEIGSNQPTPAGPPGIEDKQKISGWDASELRGDDGRVLVCMIRQHYSEGNGHFVGTFLMASRVRGLSMMLKDSVLNLPGGQPVQATLSINGKPFTGFEAHVLGNDEIGVFPEHGAALAQALGDGADAKFDALKVETMEFPVVAGVVPWLRACSRRWGISFETANGATVGTAHGFAN
jgi:hypothetical protein